MVILKSPFLIAYLNNIYSPNNTPSFGVLLLDEISPVFRRNNIFSLSTFTCMHTTFLFTDTLFVTNALPVCNHYSEPHHTCHEIGDNQNSLVYIVIHSFLQWSHLLLKVFRVKLVLKTVIRIQNRSSQNCFSEIITTFHGLKRE